MTISLLVGLLCSFVYFAEPLDHMYWNTRYKFGGHPTTLPVVIVTLDNTQSPDGEAGWNTAEQAALLNAVRNQLPHRVYLDARVDAGLDPANDQKLKQAVQAYGEDFGLVARNINSNLAEPVQIAALPLKIVPRPQIYISNWDVNFLDYAKRSRRTIKVADDTFPAFAWALSPQKPENNRWFTPDFSLDPASVPTIDASKLLSGRFLPGLLAGRTVILSDMYVRSSPVGYFGRGRIGELYVDLAGAEGLTRPTNVGLQGIAPLFLVVLLIFIGRRSDRRILKYTCYFGAFCSVFVLPAVLMEVGVFVSPDASMVALFLFASLRVWQKWRRRIEQTSSSGLPNLVAMTLHPVPVGRDIVVAAVGRYEEILATLPKDLHAQFAQQIARRLSVGSGCNEIFDGDGGHFAWSEEARPLEMQMNHLEGLRALFSAPLKIGMHTFDTNIHFGLDRNEGLSALTRVNSALASANEAMKNGRPVELYQAERIAEAPWELSLHARIDEGLRNGDIWLAFQPQWHFREKRMCGAEALIRWNHPLRGPIAPDAFILQAERAGRIDALTYWVLDEAITAALKLNETRPHFQMSINLSAQMVDKPGLVSHISEIVTRRGIDPVLLTIEVTETCSVHNRPAARHNLAQLRSQGFRLSIDDFGTGEASLAYLAELLSDELKLDRRFVSQVTSSFREREIVQHTITLAHALGQAVVAEGIEDEATFLLLEQMGCDLGQGYYLGRPVPFQDFVATIQEGGRSRLSVV